MARLMIYGATGYTGRMASEHAKSLALDFMLAGRTETKLKELSIPLGVPYCAFDIDDSQTVDAALAGITVLLNCAGPFMRTAAPLIGACIRNGVHYLDIAAELDSYRLAEERDEEAKRVKVMLMPGCGGSVAMLGCLAGHVVERVKDVVRIDVALHVAGSMSRGSAVSAAENLSTECLQRIDGELARCDGRETRQFDFSDGRGPVACFPVTLPDLITIWRSTHVSNIGTFVNASGDAFPTGDLDALPDGPTSEQRDASPYHAAVAVTAAEGTVKRAVLHTVNGYTFTPVASVEAARRVFAGETRPGFQTPAIVFGSGFLETVAGSKLKDLS
ncbi:Saccharopine dehydrogenase [Pleurostoma richardsiae]|uniref:Saccharopine dehydrogenase n=1 Tax=Pleurostoma richardsiae TaxID=41990 RepID=A0AA38VH77_9PEZI|nr:Saccharopine dehydrogenase [Pleurostoma richardsiae]